MKSLVAAAMAVLAAGTSGAWAQVYGGEDDPYQQSPFASNSYVPPPEPAAATPATPAPASNASAPSVTPPDSGKTQAAAKTGQDEKPKTGP